MSDEDLALITAIAAGDESAMETFYKRHESTVYYFALKTLRQPVDASEVLNEVMMEVWRSAGRFAGKSKARTWLLGIAHHKVVDAVRKKARNERWESDEEAEEQADTCNPFDAAQGAQRQQWIKYCMERLAQAQKHVVHLTFFEGLPYPEIAGILNIPEGTVKTRMHHAKKSLMQCLERFLRNE